MSEISISLHPNFIDEADREALLAYAANAEWETYMPREDIWYGRYVNYVNMPPDLKAIMGPMRARVAAQIRQDYQLTTPLYADTLQLVRWREGDWQAPHADAENPGGVPHPYPWRAFGSIIYLNDDYEGGQIYFPTLELRPKITPGLLAFFPGTLEFLHGVEPVTRGVRYTIASFFTFDASKHDGYPV